MYLRALARIYMNICSVLLALGCSTSALRSDAKLPTHTTRKKKRKKPVTPNQLAPRGGPPFVRSPRKEPVSTPPRPSPRRPYHIRPLTTRSHRNRLSPCACIEKKDDPHVHRSVRPQPHQSSFFFIIFLLCPNHTPVMFRAQNWTFALSHSK